MHRWLCSRSTSHGIREANSALGYAEGGDKLIRIVGEALAQIVRRGEFPARLHTAGDEFGLLLPVSRLTLAYVQARSRPRSTSLRCRTHIGLSTSPRPSVTRCESRVRRPGRCSVERPRRCASGSWNANGIEERSPSRSCALLAGHADPDGRSGELVS
jgi:hypothetical protein